MPSRGTLTAWRSEPMGNSKLNKAKYKVNQGNPHYQYKLGAERIEGSPVEKEQGDW